MVYFKDSKPYLFHPKRKHKIKHLLVPVVQSAQFLNTGLTPLKFNIAREKWWLEDYFPLGPGNFSGAMLNFSVVYFHQYMVTVQPLTFTLVNTEADRLKVSDEGKLLLVSW